MGQRHLIVSSNLWCVAALACLIAVGAGCGGGGTAKPKTVAVKGKVTYKGQPLTGGMASFAPVGADGRRAGTGPINSNGEFVISSFEAGDGVQPGEYKVFFSPAESADGSKKEVPKSTFPKKYESAATTDITEKIDAAKTVTYQLKD